MRNFGKKSLDEMKERLRMRGFLPPEDLDPAAFDEAIGGDDDVEDDEPFDEAEA
jgi:hypothetical protein